MGEWIEKAGYRVGCSAGRRLRRTTREVGGKPGKSGVPEVKEEGVPREGWSYGVAAAGSSVRTVGGI